MSHTLTPAIAKVLPDTKVSVAPHASGGGAASVSYTGTSAVSFDLTALVGRYVKVFNHVTSDGSDGGVWKAVWHTSATPPSLVSASATTGALAPTTKMYDLFTTTRPLWQVVDVDRPYLHVVPAASVSTAENVIVLVDQPT